MPVGGGRPGAPPPSTLTNAEAELRVPEAAWGGGSPRHNTSGLEPERKPRPRGLGLPAEALGPSCCTRGCPRGPHTHRSTSSGASAAGRRETGVGGSAGPDTRALGVVAVPLPRGSSCHTDKGRPGHQCCVVGLRASPRRGSGAGAYRPRCPWLGHQGSWTASPHPHFLSAPGPSEESGVTYLSGSQGRTGSRCCFSETHETQ